MSGRMNMMKLFFPLLIGGTCVLSSCDKVAEKDSFCEVEPDRKEVVPPVTDAQELLRLACLAVEQNAPEELSRLIKMGLDVNSPLANGHTLLQQAAMFGFGECVRVLLAVPGIKVDVVADFGQDALFEAAWRANLDCVQQLLSARGADAVRWPALTLAIIQNDAKQVEQLIAAGADVNDSCYGKSPLWWAAKSGYTECVRLLLAVPGIDITKNTPFVISAAGGHIECLKLFLEQPGVDVNQMDGDKWTAIQYAAWYGFSDCVKFLLDVPGIKPNEGCGRTALWCAARQGNAECLRLLLAHGPADDVDNALGIAAEFGHTECVRILAQVPGVNVNMHHPLLYAVRSGQVETVQALLEIPGIDVNDVDDVGLALGLAAESGYAEIVELLLAAPGIDVNCLHHGRNDASLHAAIKAGQTACVKLLLAVEGIELNNVDNEGFTPLCRAIRSNNLECVKLLLSLPGLDLQEGKPLIWAVELGCVEMVKLLLAHPEINVNVQDEKGDTPLHYAAGRGYPECMRLLLAAPGIEVNKVNEMAQSPLFYAAKGGWVDCLDLLLAAPEIDPFIMDAKEETPVSFAIHHGRLQCVKRLLEKGPVSENFIDYLVEMADCYNRVDIAEFLRTFPVKK